MTKGATKTQRDARDALFITQRHAEENEWRQYSVNGRLREFFSSEKQVSLARSVEFRELEGHPLLHVLVEGPQG